MASNHLSDDFSAAVSNKDAIHPWTARFEGVERGWMVCSAWLARTLAQNSQDPEVRALRERADAFEATQPSYAAALRADAEAAEAAQHRGPLGR